MVVSYLTSAGALSMIHRHVATCVAILVLLVTPVAAEAVPSTPSDPPDRYVSNPTDDPGIADYCAGEAQLANNLDRQGDRDRAEQVVGAANMRGCRIYTFRVA
ncbi:hypothetical protein ACFYVR_01380 [Rhodococcus sp. NPDC003318]|uniref:hypothetical protein n=1 Tax=Rhodococcus sp. NPDC003318 TaxID=3364503 RepID=UPI0036CCFAE1